MICSSVHYIFLTPAPLEHKIVTIWRITVALWEHIYRKKLDGFRVKETSGGRDSKATAGPFIGLHYYAIRLPLRLKSHNVVYSTYEIIMKTFLPRRTSCAGVQRHCIRRKYKHKLLYTDKNIFPNKHENII
jgi:hypothetical protein